MLSLTYSTSCLDTTSLPVEQIIDKRNQNQRIIIAQLDLENRLSELWFITERDGSCSPKFSALLFSKIFRRGFYCIIKEAAA